MRRLLNSFLRITAIVFALLGIAAQASAIPLKEYHQNLQRAITALDTLSLVDEDETNESYQHRLVETSNAVGKILPERETVESSSSSCIVDNSWLHKRLDEFKDAGAADQPYIHRQLIDRLKSIEERVTELERATTFDAPSKSEANKKMAEILARPEYATKTNQGAFIFRLIDRFIRWLAKFFPQRSPLASSHGSPFTAIAQVLVIALAAAVIIYVLIKLAQHFGRRSSKVRSKSKKEPRIVLGEHLEPEASATDLLAEAEALARKGEIRAAIRKTYVALLVELGDRKIISLAQHKTNRDYLRAVSNVPSLYSNMGGLTNTFERHWYGFAQSTQSDWQEFKTGYLAALKATE